MRAPSIRTHADPLSTLPLRRFEVRTVGLVRSSYELDAIGPRQARYAGAVVLGVHYSRLVAVEVEPMGLGGRALA